MTESNESRFQKLGRAITSVAAAAAALMAPHVAADTAIFRLINKTSTPFVHFQADERSTKRPKQLVLKPATNQGIFQFAGHRSHSSHSSHRSHVSGSSYRGHVSHTSHRSHVSGSGFAPSSSGGMSSPGATLPAPRKFAPDRKRVTRTNDFLDSATPLTEDPAQEEPQAPRQSQPTPQRPSVDSTPRPLPDPMSRTSPEPALLPVQPDPPQIDFNNPEERFQVVGFARTENKLNATILDLKTQDREIVSQGDMVAEYTVSFVDLPKRKVWLEGPNSKIFVLKMKKSSH